VSKQLAQGCYPLTQTKLMYAVNEYQGTNAGAIIKLNVWDYGAFLFLSHHLLFITPSLKPVLCP